MCDLEDPNFEKELYYLIIKFLENGPCKEAAEILRTEVDKNGFVIPRKDWKGNDHPQDLNSYNARNNHIPSDYLSRLFRTLNSLVETTFPASVRGLRSFLTRGNLSLLRDGKSSALPLLTTSKHAAVVNCRPKILSLKLKKTSLVPILNGIVINGTSKHANIVSHCHIYGKICMHKQILGHLASVYCVLFDQTGSIIVTGADDNLLKVWSIFNGRLIATFRGHSGQITDISINRENTLLASGSNDKTVRVWSLKNTQPVAVLQGHTGIITSLQFSPGAHSDTRYLMSTGGDGHVCFWVWNYKTTEFNLTPIRFNEKSRPGAQMLCSSFSPGGSFLATGSSDNYIRVYQLYPDGPEKIAELANHADHVDSILFCHTGDRFLSGSRDGTAMIWCFKNSEWQAKCIDASMPVDGNPNKDANNKLKVTMICWNISDHYVITAGTDTCLRVWNSWTTQMLHVLKGHTDEVYILEAHPQEPNIILSAGHDGNIILWDIFTCEKIRTFFNMLQGQGHGAIFDCKFSPTGLQFSATDSHGHLLLFGFGSDDPYKVVPYEQFFHTDYRPIIRDSNNYVLDEQTQTAPHLMPPPFLVDIDGNPYPGEYQLLIPGRNFSNQPQLREVEQPNLEDLPPLLAEIAAAEAAERNLRSPNRSRQPSVVDPGADLLSPGGGGLGLRESGDVEGVRQQNRLYISGDITDADADAWRNRVIIPHNNLYNEVEDERYRYLLGLEELATYTKEKLKATTKKQSESVLADGTKHFLRSCGRGGRGRGRTRQARVRQHVTYVRGSALHNHNYNQQSSGREVINIDGDPESSDTEPEDWQGESSDSTDDSDWVEERTNNKDAERLTRKRRQKRALSSEPEDNENMGSASRESSDSDSNREVDDNEEDINVDVDELSGSNVASDTNELDVCKSRGKQKVRPQKLPRKKQQQPKRVKKEIKFKKPVPDLDDVEKYLQFYQPPDWLLSVEPRKFPYFPQIGDEVYYLRQGHMLYVQEVVKLNEYDIQEGRQAYRRYDLSPGELCKLVGISYDVGPPKMCSLKLELIGKKRSTGGKKTITVRFHDMPNVVDFLVLRHIFEQSLHQNWREGDRFRCIIDDSWYFGEIVEVSPFSEEFPTSSFQCLVVKWDSGDDERLSPWDLEVIPNEEEEEESPDNTPLTTEDKLLYKYPSTEQDWPFESEYEFIERICKGLEDFSALEIASPFAFPVDVRQYPTYWKWIAFPTDLETIRSRLKNQFYRRVDCVLWEIRQLRSNAVKFNEAGSTIVLDASFVVKVLCKFIKDPTIKDVTRLHDDMKDVEESKVHKPYYDDRDSEEEEEGAEEDEDDDEDEEVIADEVVTKKTDSAGSSSANSNASNSQDWLAEAKSLLEFISSKDDAQPFRLPVNIQEFPDYATIINEPMDISTVRHRLDGNQYDTAEAFITDFQLIFKNSKTYNTDRRSLIYKMTLRLSTLFEARCEKVRQAFVLSSQKTLHWTRGRTRRHRIDSLDASDLSASKTNVIKENGKHASEARIVDTISDSPKEKKITIEQFVQRPATRARLKENVGIRNNRRRNSNDCDIGDENKSQSTRALRNGKIQNISLKREASESESSSESEGETRDSSLEAEVIKTKNEQTRSRSGRVTNKRRRYGFDESDEEVMKESKRKKKTNGGVSKKQSVKTSDWTNERSSRRRRAINYCEDDYDELVEYDDDNVGDDVHDESEEEEQRSSSTEDEQTKYVTGISSRGRVRRAAARFSDVFEK